MASRILYLDGIPQKGLVNIHSISSREDVERLYSETFRLQNSPEVTLDCRTLPQGSFSLLLKFVEEYPGSVIMVANDPVSSPILSRFVERKKIFTPTPGQLVGLRFRKVPNSIRAKVGTLFGIVVRDDDDDEQVSQ